MPRLSLPSAATVPGREGIAALSRRVRTLIVAGVLFLVLFVLALVMPVPYVILSPGPTYNTLGTYRTTGGADQQIIGIDGRTAARRSGHLNLTTVSVTESVSAFEALAGWLQHDQIVVPRAAVYPPGQSQQQTDTQNKADFQQSQDSATAAAFCELGYPKGFGVIDVEAGGPSDGRLKPGDEFVSVAGMPVTSRTTLDAALASGRPREKVAVVVKRAGAATTVTVTLGSPPKGSGRTSGGYLGVVPDNTCLAPFTVDLGLGNQIGGPSAGLMFALGIMDKVGGTDLTRGRFIAGTGTIDTSGTVGPIGGIALKMIAARAKGATVFLAPAGNCSDVRGAVPGGLRVVKVDTLHHAVQDLLKIEQNQPVPGC